MKHIVDPFVVRIIVFDVCAHELSIQLDDVST